jgi:predicted lipase
VIFTGHSLGGALAELLAIRCLSYIQGRHNLSLEQRVHYRRKLSCCTFGKPLVGNDEFRQYVVSCFPEVSERFHHYINSKDGVPKALTLYTSAARGALQVG